MKALTIKSLIFIILILLSNVLQAQIYKCENSIGEINFSDEPCVKGENSTRLKNIEFNTLKGQRGKNQSAKQKKSSNSKTSQSQRTAEKAKKNDAAYVLLSLKTTTQLELETNSLRSSLGEQTTDLPELLLSDGIIVDLLKVNKMLISHAYGQNTLDVKFILDDDYEETKVLKKPFPVITGKSKIGRFSKSLGDIKQIEFFNSAKLRKERAKSDKTKSGKFDKSGKESNKNKIKKHRTSRVKETAEQSPLIELDLSHQLETKYIRGNKNTAQENKQKKNSIIEPKRSANMKNKVQLVLTNDRKTWLLKPSLNSSRAGRKAGSRGFILNDHETIPFDQIKAIKVRVTQDQKSLVVAVSLKTGEIKMENMSKPFTRISATSGADFFDRSLLDIKSISF